MAPKNEHRINFLPNLLQPGEGLGATLDISHFRGRLLEVTRKAAVALFLYPLGVGGLVSSCGCLIYLPRRVASTDSHLPCSSTTLDGSGRAAPLPELPVKTLIQRSSESTVDNIRCSCRFLGKDS